MSHTKRLFAKKLTLLLLGSAICMHLRAAEAPKPNIVLILTDDQGYGDLSCFDSKTLRTPHIDRLAKEGRKFTSFMVASSVCSPSRAALLTGCYPKRIGMEKRVLFPNSNKGLSPDELTIADYLRAQGYATACIGKWHLGHLPEVLPTANGFDTYFGIPYSNDMNHPDNSNKPKLEGSGLDKLWENPNSALTRWKTPLMENETIIECPVDQRTVTRRYTQKAIDFIKANRGKKPFFVYLPHSMPHIPLYVPDDVRDPNPKKAYINTIEHVDAEVGRLLDTLDELDLAKNTYVIFTSDNGPWLRYNYHAGSAGPLRGGKTTTFEGGQRVPCLIRGPGVPSGTVCNELIGTIDILPTIAEIIGTPLPSDKVIDGVSTLGLWNGTAKQSPRNEFLYYSKQGNLDGIRQGKWKLLGNNNSLKNEAEGAVEYSLFDLETDVGEKKDVAKAHPELASKLAAHMLELDAEISKNARKPWEKK